VLITIDDGPSKYGRGMADTLIKHKAKAIFFINGIHDKNNKGNIKYELDLGFTIGNHTWSHPNLKKEKNLDTINKEIDKDTKLITDITGSAPKFFRAPYGVSDARVKAIIKKDNMIFMNWSGSAIDWESNTKDENIFLGNVMKDLHPGEIILIHEHPQTAKYLDKLLTTLEEKGYSFADPNQITQ
jgi:peptidoglycan/xylan/chitin deacetylase (PgdA/CDA1 family)